jgi:hypothetical protein
LRPGIRCGRTLSSTRKVGLAPARRDADPDDGRETSPFAVLLESGVDALALGLALHAESVAAAANRLNARGTCIIMVKAGGLRVFTLSGTVCATRRWSSAERVRPLTRQLDRKLLAVRASSRTHAGSSMRRIMTVADAGHALTNSTECLTGSGTSSRVIVRNPSAEKKRSAVVVRR